MFTNKHACLWLLGVATLCARCMLLLLMLLNLNEHPVKKYVLFVCYNKSNVYIEDMLRISSPGLPLL